MLRARLLIKAEVTKYEELLDQLHYLGSSEVSLTKRLRYVVVNEDDEWCAVREIIGTLNIRNTIVSADAMHAQRETAERILEGGGDYAFTVKDNQQTLLYDIVRLHEKAFSPNAQNDSESSRQNRHQNDLLRSSSPKT